MTAARGLGSIEQRPGRSSAPTDLDARRSHGRCFPGKTREQEPRHRDLADVASAASECDLGSREGAETRRQQLRDALARHREPRDRHRCPIDRSAGHDDLARCPIIVCDASFPFRRFPTSMLRFSASRLVARGHPAPAHSWSASPGQTPHAHGLSTRSHPPHRLRVSAPPREHPSFSSRPAEAPERSWLLKCRLRPSPPAPAQSRLRRRHFPGETLRPEAAWRDRFVAPLPRPPSDQPCAPPDVCAHRHIASLHRRATSRYLVAIPRFPGETTVPLLPTNREPDA
ncbi:hypothetical protein EV292_11628 [Sphingomonas sp. BK235]|nr:hypothetical protein EV292_11628 [Sphingomonas sp. BK235]